jgi:hypothetical protein
VRKFANICEILDGESKSFSPAGQMPPMNKILQINIYIYIYACVMDAFKQEYNGMGKYIYIYNYCQERYYTCSFHFLTDSFK